MSLVKKRKDQTFVALQRQTCVTQPLHKGGTIEQSAMI